MNLPLCSQLVTAADCRHTDSILHPLSQRTLPSCQPPQGSRAPLHNPHLTQKDPCFCQEATPDSPLNSRIDLLFFSQTQWKPRQTAHTAADLNISEWLSSAGLKEPLDSNSNTLFCCFCKEFSLSEEKKPVCARRYSQHVVSLTSAPGRPAAPGTPSLPLSPSGPCKHKIDFGSWFLKHPLDISVSERRNLKSTHWSSSHGVVFSSVALKTHEHVQMIIQYHISLFLVVQGFIFHWALWSRVHVCCVNVKFIIINKKLHTQPALALVNQISQTAFNLNVHTLYDDVSSLQWFWWLDRHFTAQFLSSCCCFYF